MTPFGAPFPSLSSPRAAGRTNLSVADRAAVAVRQTNARDCLLILRDAGRPLTVADLATRSGLSRPTIDAVLQDLLAGGSVRTAEPTESSARGRPARRFVADPSSTLVAGVEVGARAIRCTVADAAGRMVARTRSRLEPHPTIDILDVVAETVTRTAVAAFDDQGGCRLAAVGLAVPGIIDRDHLLARSAVFPEWTGVDLGSELSRRLGCAVVAENSLKLAAYAEHHIGRTAGNMIFVGLDRKISVALMIGGHILQGSHRMAGEICAQRGIRWTTSYDEGGLRWSCGRDARPVLDRAAGGDQQAVAEIDAFCAQVASRLATMVLTLDPEVVVVGGALSLAGELLLGPLRRQLDHLLTTPARPEVVAARFVTDGAVAGALGHAFDRASEQIFGIPAVPPPWPRLRATIQTDPGCRDDHWTRNDRHSTEE